MIDYDIFSNDLIVPSETTEDRDVFGRPVKTDLMPSANMLFFGQFNDIKPYDYRADVLARAKARIDADLLRILNYIAEDYVAFDDDECYHRIYNTIEDAVIPLSRFVYEDRDRFYWRHDYNSYMDYLNDYSLEIGKKILAGKVFDQINDREFDCIEVYRGDNLVDKWMVLCCLFDNNELIEKAFYENHKINNVCELDTEIRRQILEDLQPEIEEYILSKL